MTFENIPQSSEWTVRTVKEAIEERAQTLGDEHFVHFPDESYSYAEVNARANEVAHSLSEHGLETGDTVCSFLGNSIEHLSLLFGTVKLGAIYVPINTALKADGLAYIINDSDASVIVVDAKTVENYQTARDELEGIEHNYIVGEERDDFTPFSNLRDGDSGRNPEVDVAEDDCASIIYTSGTTGLPKGVMLPHFSYVNTGWQFVDHVDMRAGDRPFTTLPLFHCNAQQLTVMGSLLAETDFAMMPWFSASRFWDQIREFDATLFNYIGTMIQVLYNQDEGPTDGDHDLRLGIGAAAPQDIIPEFEARFDVQLLEGYGQTETATVVSFVPPGQSEMSAQGKVGRIWDHVTVEIVDENDHPVPQGEEGEIVVRPTRPNTIMMGYYGKDDKTVSTWANLWHHTGDIGRFDADGDLQFVDRKAFFIRRRGENISSYEVENAVASHRAVAESAAIGVPSELGEEDIKIVVRTKPDRSVEPLDLVKHCEERLAYFKVPRYVEFTDSFPKTETERIQKTVLKEEGIGNAWDRKETGYTLDR